jgi:endonuclease YncB( thermonuclease family)
MAATSLPPNSSRTRLFEPVTQRMGVAVLASAASTAGLQSRWLPLKLLARAVLAAGIAFGLPRAAAAFEANGVATAIDADTLDVGGGPRVRLFGIDAPEIGQRCKRPEGREWKCGIEARNRLADLVDGKEVRCAGDAFDDYQRLLARCAVDGVEVNALLVREGLAWAFIKYSRSYVDLEAAARAGHLGIWNGTAQPAWKYRAKRWEVAAATAPQGCPIKGNISRDGERIYHAPWSPWYDRTSIDTAKGERWFCDERQALEAGWRAPRWTRKN